MNDHRQQILANAKTLRRLNDEINRTYRAEPHGRAHHAACALFHSQFSLLAFPGGLTAMASLTTNDPDIVETAIQYLEVEPRFFRSGYLAEEILHRLKRVTLNEGQVTRLGAIVCASLSHGGRRRFTGCARLARVLKDPRVTGCARNLLSTSNPETRRRAQRLLELCNDSDCQSQAATSRGASG